MSTEQTRSDRRSNVLFVTIDQWRADSLGCAGHPCASTPNIDALAARGVRFSNHFAQTSPCGPSRASMLTGTYLHRHRSVFNGTPLDSRLTNLALEMRAVGYEPTLFGYTDTTVDPTTVTAPDDPRLRTYEGVLAGFDVEVQLPEAADAWLEWLRPKGIDAANVWELYERRDRTGAEGRGSTWAPVMYSTEQTEAAFLVERFGSWLARRSADAPWFAHVTFLRPHPPYVAPQPWNDLIDPANVPMPARHADVADEAAQHPMLAKALGFDPVLAPAAEVEIRQLRATYLGMLAEVDHQFGRLVGLVEAAGTDETLVVLTSDHGDELGDHWLMHKLGFFDGSYHVPLVIAGAGVAPGAQGRVVDEFTEHVDLMPTILDMVGHPTPTQCQGASLVEFTSGRTPPNWRDAAHWEWDYRALRGVVTPDDESDSAALASSSLAVLRDARGKYVHFADMPAAFYDLLDDPNELRNLVNEPDAAALVLEYAQRLLSWRMSSNDDTLANRLATEYGMITLGDGT